MVKGKVTITMYGTLPDHALSQSYKSLLERRIENDVGDTLGEYEILGEFFGDDDRVYALFLEGVTLENAEKKKEPSSSRIATLEAKIRSLEEKLEKTESQLESHTSKPTKYRLEDLTITYTALPFCEHCGNNHEEYGVQIADPSGSTSWCLHCFTCNYELDDKDVATIEKNREKKEKAYYKRKAK